MLHKCFNARGCASLMAPEVAAKQCSPLQEKPRGSISPFATADGIIMLGAFKPSQYRKLSQCLKEQGFEICSLSGGSMG